MARIKKAQPKKNQYTSDYKSTRTANARSQVRSDTLKPSKVVQRSKPTLTPRIALVEITPPNRQEMIAVAAYYKAEKRAFTPGGEIQDWLEAEKEINRLNRLT